MPEEELIAQRKEKLEKLRKKGVQPYPYRFEISADSQAILQRYKNLKAGEETKDKFILAGRIVSLRRMGKASFAHLKDRTGKIQVYFRKDRLNEANYNLANQLDIGDFIGVEGTIFKTRTSEITLLVKNLQLLAKSLRPLPEKWHGLKDIETRYRQRYVDLIANPGVKEIFLTRARIIKAIREWLDKQEFVEVETPMMQSIVGGARARPFKTHHLTLDLDLYLRIAPELYLKRLVVGGLEKVYEISRNFRNEGIDYQHNPEFTMLELYQAYSDYNDIMNLCEQLCGEVVRQIKGAEKFSHQGKEINLVLPWPRKKLKELFATYAGENSFNWNDEKALKQIATRLGVEYEPDSPGYKIFDHIFQQKIQPDLIQPTFVIDYPREFSPLAKAKRGDPELVERFELFIGGLEIANAYSELNDPLQQRQRMEEQAKELAAEREGQLVDEDYLRALEYGMPPCGGLGIGIDRLVMLLTDSRSIREVILFPQLRPEKQK